MAPLRLSIVTAEQSVLERDDVQRVVAPTTEGQITVLPGHAALMASLDEGELRAVAAGGEEPFAVHGGFIQVLRDEVTVLADAAERVSEIDEERAEEARRRARERLEGSVTLETALDLARARRALLRAETRIRIRRRRRGPGAPPPPP